MVLAASSVCVVASECPALATTTSSIAGRSRCNRSRTSANQGPLSLPPMCSTGHRIRAASWASNLHRSSAGRSESKNVSRARSPES